MGMLKQVAIGKFGDDEIWRERSEYWSSYKPSAGHSSRKKYKYREPLILCGHGLRISVDHRTLLVRNGFTHYPQKPEESRFFPGDANLPDRVVVIDGSGGITFDALNWMAEQNIEFVRLSWQGKVINIGNGPGYSANLKLVDAQRAIRGTKRQVEIARWLIAAKIENSILTLRNSIPKSENREIVISKLEGRILEIRNPRNSFSVPKLLGIEGPSARDYFGAWRGLPLNWKGLKRKPIPADWKEFSTRKMGWRKRSRVARHPINAMLNYGYGILANQVRSEIIAAGLDPTIGILHGNSENPNPLVYDLMEPLRPQIDQIVLELVKRHDFSPGDFTINKWGGCRLNPQMTKTLIASVSIRDCPDMTASFLPNLLCLS
jgi:CRISPR-associated protein Cas1